MGEVNDTSAASSAIGKEVAEKLEARKAPMFKATKKGYFVVRVDLKNVYEALGVLADASQYVHDMLAAHRMMVNKAKEANKIQIASGDTLKKGAMQNPNFLKKIIK